MKPKLGDLAEMFDGTIVLVVGKHHNTENTFYKDVYEVVIVALNHKDYFPWVPYEINSFHWLNADRISTIHSSQ